MFNQSELIIKRPKRNGYCVKLEDIRNTLYYISRNGELELEDCNGYLISGKTKINKLPLYKVKESEHIVLSMLPNTDPAVLEKTVRDFAQETFTNEYWVMVRHSDTSHPHCHLIVLYTR